MQPSEPRVKAYGLIEFTRSGYLKVQAIVLSVTLVLMVAGFLWRPSGALAQSILFGNLGWVFLLVLILELGETAVMLQKFRKKETLQGR